MEHTVDVQSMLAIILCVDSTLVFVRRKSLEVTDLAHLPHLKKKPWKIKYVNAKNMFKKYATDFV